MDIQIRNRLIVVDIFHFLLNAFLGGLYLIGLFMTLKKYPNTGMFIPGIGVGLLLAACVEPLTEIVNLLIKRRWLKIDDQAKKYLIMSIIYFTLMTFLSVAFDIKGSFVLGIAFGYLSCMLVLLFIDVIIEWKKNRGDG